MGLCKHVHVPPAPTTLDTYVIKLFDRSVDLAQFSENTPLYPICRAWMRNSPTVRERERSPGSPLPPLPEDEEVGWARRWGGRWTLAQQPGREWVDGYKVPSPQASGIDRHRFLCPLNEAHRYDSLD